MKNYYLQFKTTVIVALTRPPTILQSTCILEYTSPAEMCM